MFKVVAFVLLSAVFCLAGPATKARKGNSGKSKTAAVSKTIPITERINVAELQQHLQWLVDRGLVQDAEGFRPMKLSDLLAPTVIEIAAVNMKVKAIRLYVCCPFGNLTSLQSWFAPGVALNGKDKTHPILYLIPLQNNIGIGVGVGLLSPTLSLTFGKLEKRQVFTFALKTLQ